MKMPVDPAPILAALKQRDAPGFHHALKRAIRSLPLPLSALMQHGSRPRDSSPEPVILAVEDMGGMVRIRFGLFFQSIDAGCACEDDPTPINDINEYAELALILDMAGHRAWLEPASSATAS